MKVGDLIKHNRKLGVVLQIDDSSAQVQCFWDNGRVTWVIKWHCESVL